MARFNSAVTEPLLSGALDALRRYGARDEDIDVVAVPGAFELPLCAEILAASGRYDAVVCLGAVVRGETPHFEHIAREAAAGLARVAERHRVPVAFGVLTTDTVEQALARAGGSYGNKGYEAATTAIEMANLVRQLGCGRLRTGGEG